VESPPTNDLPRQLDNRIAIEMSDQQRVIYLRPGDTVCLEAEYHDIKILAVHSNEIQVKSSLQQPAAYARTTSGAPEDDDEDTEDDDDDLDVIHSGDEDATSDTVGGPAIRETPSKPSRGDNNVLPTATGVNNAQYATESVKGPDTSTPAAMQPQDDAESNIFKLSKGEKPPTKYRRTPKQKRQIATDGEIMESSEAPGEDDAAIEAYRGETRYSPPKRKHSMTDDDDDDGAIPASTAPPLKRSRRRPTKASKATNAATKKVAAIKPRRKHGLSPDLDPRSSATPQSPGTPMTGKPPNKILLSNSKFAKDIKAKSWLTGHGAAISDDIPGKRANFICVVGTGELATTAKVLRSLALGKKVVTDQWIEDSMDADQLLDLEAYIHDDLGETAHLDRGELLKGKTLFITDAQMKAYGGGVDNIKLLATAVGAWKVESGSVRKGSSMPAANTIFIGGDGNDPDALKLAKDGRTVYQKTLLTHSVIKGELLIDEEELEWQPNQLQPTPKSGKKGKR
jgi:hypothetical protein